MRANVELAPELDGFRSARLGRRPTVPLSQAFDSHGEVVSRTQPAEQAPVETPVAVAIAGRAALRAPVDETLATDEKDRPHGSLPHHGDPTVRDIDGAGIVADGLRCRELSFQSARHSAVANQGSATAGVWRRSIHHVSPTGSSGTTKWYNGTARSSCRRPLIARKPR